MEIKKDVRKRVQNIIDMCPEYTGKIEKKLQDYIQQCREVYSENKLFKTDIELLEQCIDYLYDNSTISDIMFLVTIYLEQDKTQKAIRFINANKKIDERTEEEKQVLSEIYNELKRYMNTKQTVNQNTKIEKLILDEVKGKIIRLYNIANIQKQPADASKKDQTEGKNMRLYNAGSIQKEPADVSKKEQTEEKIMRLYNVGIRQYQIADLLRIEKKVIRSTIKRLKEEGKIKVRIATQEEKIIELYNAGIAQSKIADVVGKHKTTIGVIIKRLKEEGKIKDRKAAEEEKIIELYNAGIKQSEIAYEVGKDETTISKKITKLIKEGRLQDRNIEKERMIIELYNAGIAKSKIAEATGNTYVTVLNKIKELIAEGKIQDIKLSKDPNIVEETKEESTENDERIAKKDNDEKASYVNDVKKIIDLLKEDRLLTYVKMQSFDETIRKNAIQRMDSIEILIDDLKKCLVYIDGNDGKKKSNAEEFIKRICDKYRALEEKKKQIEQARKMQLGGR